MYLMRMERAFGTGRFIASLAISPDYTAAIVHRTGLIYDAEFLPGARTPVDGAMLVVGFQGLLEVGEPREAIRAPFALTFAHSTYEGDESRRPLPWANAGEPLLVALFHFRSSDLVRVPSVGSYQRLDLTAETWSHASALFAEEQSLNVSLPRLLDDLSAIGFLKRPPARSPETTSRMERFWDAIAPQIERLDLTGSLDSFSESSGFSIRKLRRMIMEVTERFPVPFDSWREGSKRHRLRMAIIALSADEISVRDVARAVGYGSEDAMARAFRDAGMWSPSRVREGLRATRQRLLALM
jgi:AraC-like DNA-binding protein